MQVVLINITLGEGHSTAYVRRYEYERGRKRPIGQVQTRTVAHPGERPPPSALLGALAAAYDHHWADSWTLSRVAWPASPGGP